MYTTLVEDLLQDLQCLPLRVRQDQSRHRRDVTEPNLKTGVDVLDGLPAGDPGALTRILMTMMNKFQGA